MTLKASKKALETNKTAPSLPEKEVKVEIPQTDLLNAQKAEFEAWLEEKVKGSNFQFFIDMLKRLKEGKVLTPNMEAALRKCRVKDAELKKPVAEKDLPEITVKVRQWWMKEHGLDSRVITAKVLRETAKAFYIKGHADMVEGTWCMRCGKELTEPASMVIGYGPTCCEKLGIPYPDNIKTASKKERKAIRKKLMTVLKDQTFEAWIPKAQIEEMLKTKGCVNGVEY